MSNPRTALVLGATGGIGGEVARRSPRAAGSVRGFARRPPAGADGLDWRAGRRDAARPRSPRPPRAPTLIVHAVNPPGYRDWDRLVLPMLENTIAAARATGAAILLPGHDLQLRPRRLPAARPRTRRSTRSPARARSASRWRRGCAEAAAAGTPVLVVRAGDFFGPRAGNNWFSQGLVKPGQPAAVDHLPGAPGVGHAWAYLPDVAETMVRLVEAGEPRGFASFHMDGHWDPDGMAMAAAIRARPRRARPAAPPLALAAAAPRRPAGAAVPRARRDALPLAHAGPPRQPPPARHPRRRAAHAARPGGARDPHRSRLPAGRPRTPIPAGKPNVDPGTQLTTLHEQERAG